VSARKGEALKPLRERSINRRDSQPEIGEGIGVNCVGPGNHHDDCSVAGAPQPRNDQEMKGSPVVVTITLTPRAAEFFGALVCKIGGSHSGPRGEIVESFRQQLIAQGIESANGSVTPREWREYWLEEKVPTLGSLLANQWPRWSRK